MSAMIEILQIKYLNNILEQDHRFIRRITKTHVGLLKGNNAEREVMQSSSKADAAKLAEKI